ncbi:MAG: glycerol kinase GlpK [Okeania sp. SIO2C9]|uniref:glycerol kinase GlpK n=1 Tax=Okeania sp. SIO2C9 TaxID=2607791 RepID=UPI0013C10AA2|nr:glycerol kinase GlpK [Okeania sp. SIO2C9]NEQ72536.1 glycerol kinase GlpK [Okeania sp. SIO2C9]
MTTDTEKYILALDLGTTGNRAILFNSQGASIGQAYKELTQYYPHPGWLEHDPEEIWEDTYAMMEQVFRNTNISSSNVKAIGLTVQRETCLLWDKTTGKPLHKAIVWQDRRTAPMIRELVAKGKAEKIQNCTGLVLDAYFSATKLSWMLEWVKRDQPKINLSNVLAGTIDTWILWKLTGGQIHATDHSNASRTMLMNIESLSWDRELLDLFQIPREIMPEIKPSFSIFGKTKADLLGVSIPIATILGDQQAALFAHGCDRPGMLKCTYGTGSFLIANTGDSLTKSQNQLLSTIGWTQKINGNLKTAYALEGAMFTTGACIQWLRDGLKLIDSAAETEHLAMEVEDTNGVYFVPALSGLGTPHWDMNARGAFLGITGGVKRENMVRAVLESVAFQVKEVVDALNKDSGTLMTNLKVDGGGSQNNFLMQFQADLLGIPVERPAFIDATAQGAAFAAGLTVGLWDDYHKLVNNSTVGQVFEPSENAAKVQKSFMVWQKAVSRAKNWIE